MFLSLSDRHGLVSSLQVYHDLQNTRYQNHWYFPSHRSCRFADEYFITNQKLIHKYHPVKHFLERFKTDLDFSCSICSSHPETVPHFFFGIVMTLKLWQEIWRFINIAFMTLFTSAEFAHMAVLTNQRAVQDLQYCSWYWSLFVCFFFITLLSQRVKCSWTLVNFSTSSTDLDQSKWIGLNVNQTSWGEKINK